MKQLPSRLRRLDDALFSLPDEAMVLSELDGFLTGIFVCPDLIMPTEWLPIVWNAGEGEGAPFDDPADMRWFTDAVVARYNEIARDLGRGKQQPIFDVDDRNGELLWELWTDGFNRSIALRPDAWAAVDNGDDRDAADALSDLLTLIAIGNDESALDSIEINAIHESAPAAIATAVARLHAFRLQHEAVHPEPQEARPAKVGRNDPCPCGSGKKFKRCCG